MHVDLWAKRLKSTFSTWEERGRSKQLQLSDCSRLLESCRYNGSIVSGTAFTLSCACDLPREKEPFLVSLFSRRMRLAVNDKEGPFPDFLDTVPRIHLEKLGYGPLILDFPASWTGTLGQEVGS